MHIMTKYGWAPLKPLCVNEQWVLSIWDPHQKKYVPDNGPHATLRYMGPIVSDGPILKEAPPRYRGRLPSLEAIGFCAKQQRFHDEWMERRANMLSGDE
jgi:hypothetical protein